MAGAELQPNTITPGRPLAGIRIIDASTAYAGPTCTHILALLGADVIKVESITHQTTRGGMVFPDNDPGTEPWNRSGYFMKRNFGKRSLSLELNTERGKTIFERLVAGAHVVVESYRPGVMHKLGIDYNALRLHRPDVIMISLSGWGQTGPWSKYGAYGFGLDPAGGIAYLSGYPGGGPSRVGIAYLDPLSGMMGAGAVLTALLHWRRTGEGQHIDLAEAEVAPLLVADGILEYMVNGRTRERIGNRHRAMAPHGLYPCLTSSYDQWLALSCRDDRDWHALQQAMGKPAWAADDRFTTLAGRLQYQDEIDAQLSNWTVTQDKHAVAALLQNHGVPAGPVMTGKDLLLDPHLRERGFFMTVNQPPIGSYPFPRQLPVRFDGAYPAPSRPSPAFGEHNHEVLCGELGLSEDEFHALEQAGIIGDRPVTRAPNVFDIEAALARRAVVAQDHDYRTILGIDPLGQHQDEQP